MKTTSLSLALSSVHLLRHPPVFTHTVLHRSEPHLWTVEALFTDSHLADVISSSLLPAILVGQRVDVNGRSRGEFVHMCGGDTTGKKIRAGVYDLKRTIWNVHRRPGYFDCRALMPGQELSRWRALTTNTIQGQVKIPWVSNLKSKINSDSSHIPKGSRKPARDATSSSRVE
jgi:hypothetical protein